MKTRLLSVIISLVALTSALAAEDIQSVPDTSDTATIVESVANPIAEQKKPLRFLLGMGLTSGGDTLFTGVYDDGSTDSVTAGGGMVFYAGLDYRLADSVSIQGTLGYHFDKTKPAKNGSVTFSRIPLELLAYYHVNDAFRFGGGVRIVNDPKLKGSGIGSGVNWPFDNTVGVVVEGEYMMVPMLGIKLRHVSEKFKPTGFPDSVDGSHIGVLVSVYL